MTAHKRDWHQFIVECQPIAFESVTGFISRALASTAVASFPLALRLAGVNARFSQLNTIILRPDELHRLAYLFGTQPSRLWKLSLQDATRLPRNRDSSREHVARQAYSLANAGVRRVSPMALKQATFHRLSWDYSIYSFDPETLEPLLHQCPVCKMPLGWNVAGEPQYCDHCFDCRGRPTTDLRDCQQSQIEVDDAPALRFFGDLILPRTPEALSRLSLQIPSVWDRVPHRALSEIAVALAKLDLEGRTRKKRQPLSVEALCRASRTLLDGRTGLRRALQLINECSDISEKKQTFQEMSGLAQDLIQQALPDVRSDRSPHRVVATVNPAEYVASRPEIQWRLKHKMRVDTVARKAIRNPPQELPPWLQTFQNSEAISRVSDMLGIEVSDIEVLIRHKVLVHPDPSELQLNLGPERVMTAPLKLFMERLWRNVIEATDVDLQWIPFVSAHQLRERHPTLTWASIMIALAECDIPRFRRHSKWPCWYYSLCVIDPHELYRQAERAQAQLKKA